MKINQGEQDRTGRPCPNNGLKIFARQGVPSQRKSFYYLSIPRNNRSVVNREIQCDTDKDFLDYYWIIKLWVNFVDFNGYFFGYCNILTCIVCFFEGLLVGYAVACICIGIIYKLQTSNDFQNGNNSVLESNKYLNDPILEKSYSNPDIALGLSCYKKLRDSFSVSSQNRPEVQSSMDQTLKLQADPTDYLAGLGHEKIKTHLCRMLHTVCRFFQSTSVQIR